MSSNATDLQAITVAYRQGRARGRDDFDGFNAALSVHLQRHPGLPREAAAREVNRLLAQARAGAEQRVPA
ncbi:MAG: hypothetical protein RID91_14465 [Azospirillaceae bacterium]